MKTVKINFSCIWPRRTKERVLEEFFGDLKGEFNFVISDEPDYILCSCDDDNFSFLNFPKSIRIFYTNEPFHPNFQFFDYNIGFNSTLDFDDRYYYFLGAYFGIYKYLNKDKCFERIDIEKAKKILSRKNLFCDFIYNHDNEKKDRKHFLELLQTYKSVNNGGSLYSCKKGSSYNYDEKFKLESKCKFSLCIESYQGHDGFITEKIFHAIINHCIPIYYGDTNIETIVNPERFINANNLSDRELLDLVKSIDSNDDLFCKIISQPPLIDQFFFSKQKQGLNVFFRNILSQNLNSARRRPILFESTKHYDTAIRLGNKLYNSKAFSVICSVHSFFSKIFRK